MIIIKDYISGLLPSYIIQNDSFKDDSQKGFVQRYMEMFGAEIDDELYIKIEEVIDQITPYSARSEFLNYLAYNLGDLPKFIDSEAQYRRFLSFMISIYKIKGRVLSYEAIFLTLGLDITINELPTVGNTYDATPVLTYDQEGIQYDVSCAFCSDYDITVTPFFFGLIQDDLDASTGWTLDAGSSIGSGKMTLVGVSEAEAVKQFALTPSTNYTIEIDVISLTGSSKLTPRLVSSNTLVTGSAYLTLADIITSGRAVISFTTSSDANQYLQLDVDTDTETIVIESIRFWLTDDTLNPVITSTLFDRINTIVSLVEPINANLDDIIFDNQTLSIELISVSIDEFGDLIYNNDADPGLVLTLDAGGNLIITGPNESKYFVQDGDLFFIQTT